LGYGYDGFRDPVAESVASFVHQVLQKYRGELLRRIIRVAVRDHGPWHAHHAFERRYAFACSRGHHFVCLFSYQHLIVEATDDRRGEFLPIGVPDDYRLSVLHYGDG